MNPSNLDRDYFRAQIFDYLDLTFNLNTNTFKPYHEENGTPNYINVDSNNPDTILKQILITVGTRISKLSSNKYMFNINKELCDKALQKSGKATINYLT